MKWWHRWGMLVEVDWQSLLIKVDGQEWKIWEEECPAFIRKQLLGKA